MGRVFFQGGSKVRLLNTRVGWTLLLSSVVILSACGTQQEDLTKSGQRSGDPSSDETSPFDARRKAPEGGGGSSPYAPIANVEADPTFVNPGGLVILDASGSWDPDGQVSELTYEWTIICPWPYLGNCPGKNGDYYYFGNSGSPHDPYATFEAYTLIGDYVFIVRVIDQDKLFATATVTVSVGNGPASISTLN
ncbi:MAG TPA: hypothetical protein VI895_14380 [Bdellovibrionota bacterium]|nr:hypothetical protein [Bdellovibrionota bacterium]